jgi:hypothetical protein
MVSRHLVRKSNTDEMRVCEDSSRFVCKKTRARLLQSSRLHHPCRFISWESEELGSSRSVALAAGTTQGYDSSSAIPC